MRTIVSGFLRSGATAVLKMVEAAGIPILVDDPDRFLYSPVMQFRRGGDWPADTDDRAVKVMEPHIYIPPRGDYRAIWIDRDPTQQAKSQIKFAASRGIRLKPTLDVLVKGILHDRVAAMRVLQAVTAGQRSSAIFSPLLQFRFEDLIEHPLEVAEELSVWLGQGDPKVMAAVITKRKSDCLPWRKMMDHRVASHGEDSAREFRKQQLCEPRREDVVIMGTSSWGKTESLLKDIL